MIRKLLLALTAAMPAREISDGERPYLERYYVCTLFGVRVYLHRFVGSDPDRGLHDHPWRWACSLILAGWYIEERRDGRHVRRWLNTLGGDTFHRVVMPEGARDIWTLFVHGGRVKTWGFLRPITEPAELSDCAYFEPYAYARDAGEEQRWWEFAPSGRELRRMQENRP